MRNQKGKKNKKHKNIHSTQDKIKTMPRCPNTLCNMQLNGFTGIDEAKLPKPDDLSICIYCAELCIFDKNLNLIFFPTEKYVDLPLEERKYLDNLVYETRAHIQAKKFRERLNKH